jgi:hypothetical protein
MLSEDKKCRFNCINKLGIEEPFSGGFSSIEEASKWLQKHGKGFKERGLNLILVKNR